MYRLGTFLILLMDIETVRGKGLMILCKDVPCVCVLKICVCVVLSDQVRLNCSFYSQMFHNDNENLANNNISTRQIIVVCLISGTRMVLCFLIILLEELEMLGEAHFSSTPSLQNTQTNETIYRYVYYYVP